MIPLDPCPNCGHSLEDDHDPDPGDGRPYGVCLHLDEYDRPSDCMCEGPDKPMPRPL